MVPDAVEAETRKKVNREVQRHFASIAQDCLSDVSVHAMQCNCSERSEEAYRLRAGNHTREHGAAPLTQPKRARNHVMSHDFPKFGGVPDTSITSKTHYLW